MENKVYNTKLGDIHYWINKTASNTNIQLIFLPGLTADHTLFEKQIEYFEGKYPIFVWDAPGHASSYPFEFNFSLMDKAKWLDEILIKEGFNNPIIIGQSMGGYVGQAYSQLYPDKLKGFISIDSAPLQKEYVTNMEIWLLKRMRNVYKYYPWKSLLKLGSNGVATSKYGRELMHKIMMTYDGNQDWYSKLAGHGYKILAEAMEANLPYEIKCPALLICGEKDHAGSCIRYNKAWHKKTGIPIEWIKDAGHNSNTDKPELINKLIEDFVKCIKTKENMIIRRFEEKDAKEVSDLIVRTLREVNIKDYSKEYIENDVKVLQPENILERSTWTHMYVVCDEDKIVGCGAIGPYWDKEDESSLFTIFVLPEYHGRGIGRKIIETLESDEYFLRAKRIEIPASITATPFYLKMGYNYKNGITTPDEEGLLRLEKHR